jgi:putative FmdB family regulatory protein
MPIYEYSCTTCGHRFDRLRSVSQMDDEAPCPQCDGDSSRQLSVFAVYTAGPNGEMDAVAGSGGCGGCGPGGCACSMSA